VIGFLLRVQKEPVRILAGRPARFSFFSSVSPLRLREREYCKVGTIGSFYVLFKSFLSLYNSHFFRMIESRRMRWTENIVCMMGKRNAYRVLMGKPEGKRPLGRPGQIWKENIKMNLRKIGWGCMEWIHLTQDREQ
jgi:hypothetical protein